MDQSLINKQCIDAFSQFGFKYSPERNASLLPTLVKLFGLDGRCLLRSSSQESLRAFRLVKFLNAKRCQCVILVYEEYSESKKVLKIRPRKDKTLEFDDTLSEEFELLSCLQGKHHVIPVEEKLAFTFRHGEGEEEIVDALVFPFIRTCDSSVPYSYRQLWVYMHHLFEALAWCHANDIIHADVKPDNVLFVFDEEDKKTIDVALIDFGAACKVDDDETYERDTGTFILSPPELLSDSHYSTPRDIWAVGISVLWIVYGDPPFSMETSYTDLHESIAAFVNSANQDGKPWPSLCESHPPQFDCMSSPHNIVECVKLQKFLELALKLDPHERISAKDALVELQKYI